jgi:hypothetical protein
MGTTSSSPRAACGGTSKKNKYWEIDVGNPIINVPFGDGS